MQGVIEINVASVKNEIHNNENGTVREIVVGEHQLFTLPVIKKELNDVSQCVEIKKEVDDRDVTIQLVSIKQEAGVKQENIQLDLLKTISVKEEENKINELVRVCKSEEVLNREEGIITNCTGIQNEILKPIKIKNEHVNLVEGLFNECNVDNRSELVQFINVKNEENNFRKDLVSEYHQSKAVTNKKEAERKENKHEDVRKENSQVDKRKPIIVDLSKEMLICAVNGNQCVQNTHSFQDYFTKSILKPKAFSRVHPDNMRNRIIQDKQKVIRNNVVENNVTRDVVNISLNDLIGEEIEKQLLGEIDVQRSETELIKPIEIDSILRKSVLAFGSSCVETPDSAAVGLPMDTEEKRSSVSSNQTNKAAEPIECITLLDDDDLLAEMDDLSAKKNTTSSAMDIEFVDCSQEDDTKKNTGDASFAALQPIGSSSWVNQVTSAEVMRVYNIPFLDDSDFIRSPPKLCATKGVLNVQNIDKRSFMWSVLAILFPSKQGYRTSILQRYIDKINMCGIEYPVSLKSIDKFEEWNPDISVNVFGYEEEVYPLEYKEQIMAHMDRSVTAVDCSPILCPPPVSSSQCVHGDKPSVSYPNLIRLAITSSPINKMTVSEIYHFIIQRYPYYRSAHVGWKNIIRHTLSQNKWFMRVSGPSSCLGKLRYWTMDYKHYKSLPRRRRWR